MREKILKHLQGLLHTPAFASKMQEAHDAERLGRIRETVKFRPEFIGIKAELQAVGQFPPVEIETPSLRFQVIITGAITNSNRAFSYRRDNEDAARIYTGNDSTLRLRLDELAGRDVIEGGYSGVRVLDCPFVVDAGTVELFQVYKTDDTEDAEMAFLGLQGVRVFPEGSSEGALNADEVRRVLRAIMERPAPREIFVKCPVRFDAGGEAFFETPKLDEPLLVTGIKSTLNHSLIKLNVKGETSLTHSDQQNFVPIWTIAAQPQNERELYTELPTPIFIDSNKRPLEGEVRNSLYPGAPTDENGEITLKCQTM